MGIVHLDIEEFKAYQRDSDAIDKIQRLITDNLPGDPELGEIIEIVQSTGRRVSSNG